MNPSLPTVATVLRALTKQRVGEVARDFGVTLAASATQEAQVDTFTRRAAVPLHELLRSLGRDELKRACRLHQLPDEGRSRADLISRLLAQEPGAAPITPTPPLTPRLLPQAGDIVQVRHRQYLVSTVTPGTTPEDMTRVALCCLDDDAQGRPLEVLWELELGARVLQPETHGLGVPTRLDPPADFAAYFHAIKWNRVTATDGQLFQAPFRAGILLKDYQLTPLMKALELPRANLFIADDVGLGKTIEAGLVLQELLLRQRTDWVLIICPASVSLQWRGEMERRFGLRFEIYNREFVARRRQERGFGVNPWSTHNRFIISYQTFRRPEYRDPLLQLIGERRAKSLLILDEAHTAAPATASRYAVDSSITKTIRDAARRFENRLFLSATPHNGHSNSFSALLAILDEQRFLRGTPISDPQALKPVMIRRLKSDLLALKYSGFPVRRVLPIELTHAAGAWTCRLLASDSESAATPLGDPIPAAVPIELELSQLLAEYTELLAPKKGAGRLVFINLQKRLLSCVDAFARTLEKHVEALAKTPTPVQPELLKPEAEVEDPDQDPDADEQGPDSESLDEAEDARISAASRRLPQPNQRAQELLERMRELAGRYRSAADAKVHALLAWIRQHQCPAVTLGGAQPKVAAAARWSERRLIIFTEYGHSKTYLRRVLSAALNGTDRAAERIAVFDGNLSEQKRELLQEEWNHPDSPVRILLATDAAREGVNLQGQCADLIHFDIPWNPARMEQRNGRIDRTLQPAPEVRCMYFLYPQRSEDQVLRTLVRKVDRIVSELGSLGTVVMERITTVLGSGIDTTTAARLDQAEQLPATEVVTRELETQRRDKTDLEREIHRAAGFLNKSRKHLEFDPALLRHAIDVGLAWAGAAPLGPAPSPKDEPHLQAFTVPALPRGWQGTLDTLRPPRRRDEDFGDWRKRPPLPVVFAPPERLNTPVAHLHLQHPLVQRILARFLAQGTSAHDLSRVTVVRNRHDAITRVLAFGRLSLFGAGATRLHDQLVSVAAAVPGEDATLLPFADDEDRRSLERLEALLAEAQDAHAMAPIAARVQSHLCTLAPAHFAALWTSIQAEADAVAHDAERKLRQRGESESAALRELLRAQRDLAERTLHSQLTLDFSAAEAAQEEQQRQDRKYLEERRRKLEIELTEEPAQIQASYQVVRRRLEPVGLVYLWPATK